jgi:hypothetical protein
MQKKKCPRRTYLPVFTRLDALVERRIDVFDENETPFGRVRHQVVELVVGQATLGEVQQAYIIRQRTSECLNERGLSRPRRSMEQIASAVRNTFTINPTYPSLFSLVKLREREPTSVRIPFPPRKKSPHIVSDILRNAGREHDAVKRPLAPRQAKGAPLGTPRGMNDETTFLSAQRRISCLRKQRCE